MKIPFYPSLLAAALIGCSGGKGTDPAPVIGGDTDDNTFLYTVSGNKIITPGYVDTTYFCFGSELETDTSVIEPDTVIFSVSGNTLTLITDTDTTASMAVVQRETEFTRIGSGTGLPGTWKDGENSYRVISGALTQEEKDEIDEELATGARFEQFYRSSVTITETTITTSADVLMAELFVFQWNESFFPGAEPDSARYDITVKTLDRYTVELHGNMTGETVRIKMFANGDRTYTSSDAGNRENRFIGNSKTCPNAYEPLWYVEFLEGNSLEDDMSPAAKTTKIGEKVHQRPHFPFFPLKPASNFLN